MLLTQAIQEDPTNTRIAMDMSQIFIDMGDLEQAQELFAKIPEADRQSDMGKALSGQLAFAELTKNIPDMQTLSTQLVTNPDDHQARFSLAVHNVSIYNYEEAINHLFIIMESDPEFKEGAAKELIFTISNMLAPTHYEQAASFRQRLSNFIAS